MMAKSRGLRNCNPGNLRHGSVRYRGEVASTDDSFKCFESMAMGYRAMFVLLHTYQCRYGLKCIAEMIARYAPPTENNTTAYIEAVVQISGIAADYILDTLSDESMLAVVSAMSRVENGVGACPADVIEGWELFRRDYSSSSSSIPM